MKKIFSLILIVIMIISSSVILVSGETPAFTISGAIGNDMVFQRETEVNVWGWSSKKGETITVSFKGNTVTGTVDGDGKWLVQLPKMAADKNENTLTVKMGDYTETRTGILVGDVYILNGQSNAAKLLNQCGAAYKSDQIKALVNEAGGQIRYFQQAKADAKSEDGIYMKSPQQDVIPGKKWEKETYAVAKKFSALGFFFAHKIHKEAGVPVGVINVSCGGSPVCELMSKEAGQKSGYIKDSKEIPASGIYNALMSPFINTKIKAMIYYQGESENGLALSDYGKYNEYVNIYVEDLRAKMKQDFPFYYVQLSSHTVTDWKGTGLQRAVQFDGLNVIKNSGMVVSMDQGYRSKDSDWAHPNYKKPVGERLAALTLARLYNIGDENYVTSPMPLFAYKTDEGVVIRFKNVGDGLKVIGQHNTLSGFWLNEKAIKAEIIGKDEVLIKTKGTVNQVGYGLELLAFVDYPEGKGDLQYVANLGNSNELPAAAFKLTKIYASLDEALGIQAKTPAPTQTPAQTPAVEENNSATATAQVGGVDGPQNVEVKGNFTLYFIIGGAIVLTAAAVTVIIILKNKKSKKQD